MEVGIWVLTGRQAKENCRIVNPETAGTKKVILEKLLLGKGQKETLEALHEVFEVADRNGWIHGHVLNPNGDFSRLTRLRVQRQGTGLKVANSLIRLDVSPFAAFYLAYEAFQIKLDISSEKCNEYITSLQAA